MIATYAASLTVCGASLAIGQAAISLCGLGRWSWLSPAVGLALLCSICWACVRLPGDGATSAIAVLALTAAAATYLRGRIGGGEGALAAGIPVALAALLAASLPFVVEGHFGILGTGFNPDMSQHLLATDRLTDGAGSQLLTQGYPLGPHAVVVALNEGLGIGLVQGFSGLTIAVAVLAALTALAAFVDQPPLRRSAAALLVGLPYLVSSYFAQGAFKETIQALLVLAFVLALRESSRSWAGHPLRLVPAALIAIGSIYTYSFPGLIWLGPIAAVWLIAEFASAKGVSPAGGTTGPAAWRLVLPAFAIFLVGILPELGRMIDFHSFETFDPSGPGLGNLFGQVSPLEALGIWPSGDFRVAPGDGAAPAIAYYLGAAFGAALLLYGLVRCRRRGEHAVLAGLLSVASVYAAARLGGTAYTAAKALEIAAPVATLTIVLGGTLRVPRGMRKEGAPGGALRVAVVAYVLVAGGCSLLAFANAPVGPTSYSPALTGLRPLLAGDPTLVLAPERLLEEEHGARYIAWELRGGRVCIEPASAAGGRPRSGIRFVVVGGSAAQPPFEGLRLRRRAGPYWVWERPGVLGGPSPCPLVAVRQTPSEQG